jgi:hypothetical protein
MLADIDDFCEVDDGWVVQLALLLAGDKFDVVDLEFVLIEVTVVVFRILLEDGILVLELLYADLELLGLPYFKLHSGMDTSASAALSW